MSLHTGEKLKIIFDFYDSGHRFNSAIVYFEVTKQDNNFYLLLLLLPPILAEEIFGEDFFMICLNLNMSRRTIPPAAECPYIFFTLDIMRSQVKLSLNIS